VNEKQKNATGQIAAKAARIGLGDVAGAQACGEEIALILPLCEQAFFLFDFNDMPPKCLRLPK